MEIQGLACGHPNRPNIGQGPRESDSGHEEAARTYRVAARPSSDKLACVGADNWGLEVAPPRPPATPEVLFPVHHHLLVKSGIFMHEALKLSELANDLASEHARGAGRGQYAFFYVYNPVSIKGASGAPGAPLVIR